MALALMKEQEKICHALGESVSLSGSLCNRVRILEAWGRKEEAMELFKDVERLCVS